MRKLLKVRPHSNDKPAFATRKDNKQHSLLLPSVNVVPTTETAPGRTPTRPAPSLTPKASHEHPSPRSTLTPASKGTLNSAMPRAATSGVSSKTNPPAGSSSLAPRTPNRMNSTIRTVPSFDDRHRYSEEGSSTDGAQSHSTSRDSGFSSSLNSTASMASSNSPQRGQSTSNGIPRKPSYNRLRPSPSIMSQDGGGSENLPDGTPRALRTRPSLADIPQQHESSSLSAAAAAAAAPAPSSSLPPPDHTTTPDPGGDASLSATEAQLSNSWDNSVGKAGLGKTGRVINRLVSDNESLKRDIQIERLRAEESRQAARLLEDRLERTISDYESRLLEATVTKTLLARKERQVESLQDAVELERKRAVDAAGRERVWKDEMETAKGDAKRQVEEATNYAALMEGRYNAISSHWKEQGEEVKRSMGKMRKEVADLVVERKKDDGKIETLRELCDQQDGNIRELRKQKEDIEMQFEAYKRAQEEGLVDIKRKADEREREQERTLQEARDVLDKLKWALSVKGKIEWAQ